MPRLLATWPDKLDEPATGTSVVPVSPAAAMCPVSSQLLGLAQCLVEIFTVSVQSLIQG